MPFRAKATNRRLALRKRPDSEQFDVGRVVTDEPRPKQHALEPSASSFSASKELCEFGSNCRAGASGYFRITSPEALEKAVN